MNRFFRIMLGKSGVYAEDCYKGGFIGVDFNFGIDLTKASQVLEEMFPSRSQLLDQPDVGQVGPF